MALASEGVTTEILLRLPVRAVLRFKSVSKQWLSIASSPRFRQIHASRSRISHATGLIIKQVSYNKSLYEFIHLSSKIPPTIFPVISHPNIHLSSSSGGLLLFRSFRLQFSSVSDYIVCNPTTNEFKHLTLTFPLQFIANSLSISSYLAFNPHKSPHYKILFLCQLGYVFFDIVIYSSETERIGSPMRVIMNNYENRIIHGGYYCYDAIHWISENNCLYYFDLNKEKMKSSRPLSSFEGCKYFGESSGHLLQVAVRGGYCFVNELESDYSGWFVKYQVNLSYMANAFPTDWRKERILIGMFTVLDIIIVDKEDEENLMLVLELFGEFVAYNFKNKKCLMLGGRLNCTELYGDQFYSWQYIETLACP